MLELVLHSAPFSTTYRFAFVGYFLPTVLDNPCSSTIRVGDKEVREWDLALAPVLRGVSCSGGGQTYKIIIRLSGTMESPRPG